MGDVKGQDEAGIGRRRLSGVVGLRQRKLQLDGGDEISCSLNDHPEIPDGCKCVEDAYGELVIRPYGPHNRQMVAAVYYERCMYLAEVCEALVHAVLIAATQERRRKCPKLRQSFFCEGLAHAAELHRYRQLARSWLAWKNGNWTETPK